MTNLLILIPFEARKGVEGAGLSQKRVKDLRKALRLGETRIKKVVASCHGVLTTHCLFQIVAGVWSLYVG